MKYLLSWVAALVMALGFMIIPVRAGVDLGLLPACVDHGKLTWTVLASEDVSIDGSLSGSGDTFVDLPVVDGQTIIFGKVGDGDLTIWPSGAGAPVASAGEPSEPCPDATGAPGTARPDPLASLPPSDTNPPDDTEERTFSGSIVVVLLLLVGTFAYVLGHAVGTRR